MVINAILTGLTTNMMGNKIFEEYSYVTIGLSDLGKDSANKVAKAVDAYKPDIPK